MSTTSQLLRKTQSLRVPLSDIKVSPEFVVMGIFSIVFVIGAIYTNRICIPDLYSSHDIFNNFIAPVLIAVLIAALAVGRKSLTTAFTLFTFCVFSIFLHFNFKAWIPLINPSINDPLLHKFDVFIGINKLTGMVSQSSLIGTDWYHIFYVFAFFAAFSISSIFGGLIASRRLTFSICTSLLIGGVMYWIFPAIGSLLYNPHLYGPQQIMLDLNYYTRLTGEIPQGLFLEGLAAMPSLHLAHATIFLIHTYRAKRISCIIFSPLMVFFGIEALALGWHYSLDLVVGVILGCAITHLSFKTEFAGTTLDLPRIFNYLFGLVRGKRDAQPANQ